MKCLVTGANGFLGTHTVDCLLEKMAGNGTVRALVRKGSSLNGLERTSAEIHRGTLNDSNDLDEMLKGVDVVLHLAASLTGSPMGMFSETVVATEMLMDAISRSQVSKLVFVSSFGVYGAAALKTGALYDEETPLEAFPLKRDPYSWCKFHQEKHVRERSAQQGLPTVILRPGVIYGQGKNVLSGRIGLRLPGLPFFVLIGKRARVPYNHVRNCAQALALSALSPDRSHQILNLVDDDLPTQGEVIALYERHVGSITGKVRIPYGLFYLMSGAVEFLNWMSLGNFPDIFTRYKTRTLYRPFAFSNEKAKRILGWKPEISFRAGVQEKAPPALPTGT